MLRAESLAWVGSCAKMADDRLSPRSLALGQLIEMYATYRAELPATFPLEARQQLALILMQLVGGDPRSATSVIEPSYSKLLQALTPLPASFVAAFEQRVKASTEPDDIWTLMTSLSDLMEDNLTLNMDAADPEAGPMHLGRSSVLGMYVRRLLLYFRRASFESLCTLTTHFGQWIAQQPAATVAPPSTVPGRADTLPPWARTLPLKQLEARVHILVDQAESDLGELNADVLQEQVQGA